MESLPYDRRWKEFGVFSLAKWKLRVNTVGFNKHSREVNTKEGKELLKLKDNAGILINDYKHAIKWGAEQD